MGSNGSMVQFCSLSSLRSSLPRCWTGPTNGWAASGRPTTPPEKCSRAWAETVTKSFTEVTLQTVKKHINLCESLGAKISDRSWSNPFLNFMVTDCFISFMFAFVYQKLLDLILDALAFTPVIPQWSSGGWGDAEEQNRIHKDPKRFKKIQSGILFSKELVDHLSLSISS